MRLEHWFYTIPLRLRSLFRRRQVEAELDEELRYHLERKIEEFDARGLSREEARYAAFRAMDGLEQRKEECRDKRRTNSIENFFQDLRYGLRMLRKSPGFTAVAVLTLALGIGANTAIFTVVNAVLLRPLAYPEPDRIVNFMLGNHEIEGTSVPMFMFWREQTEVLQDFALYGEVVKGPGVNLTNTDRPERLRSIPVSADFFKLFGASIEIGRTFTAQEDVPGGPRLAVLSDGFWRRRFGADRTLVGKSILLGGEPYVVIGIVCDIEPIHSAWNAQGPSLRTDTPADVWLPVQADPNSADQGGNYRSAARLKPGVTLEMAKARTKLAEARFRQKFPGGKLSSFSFNLEPLSEAVVGNVRLGLLVLMGAVSFVLLIACANVANLQLARATGRRREMAIRAALGAGRRRIVFQLLTETLPLWLAGGALGIGFGYSVLRALLASSSVNLPRIGAQGSAVTLDSRVIIFTMLTATFTGILFGLIPAFSASHDDVSAALKENGTRSGSGLGQSKTRAILVVIEMALTLVLLAGAALLMRTFVALRTVDPGFEAHNVLTFEMSLNQARFDQTVAVARLLRDAQRRVEGIPGVEALAATRSLPLDPNPDYAPVIIEGRPPTKDRYQDWAASRDVSAPYFEVFRVPLLRGRLFTERDDERAPRVVVINETMAKAFWPTDSLGRAPLGERITLYEEPPREIIGVVADVRDAELGSKPEPMVYVPVGQRLDADNAEDNKESSMIWVVRTKSEPYSLSDGIQRELRIASGGLPVSHIRSMDQVRMEATASSNFNMMLFNIFAGIAVLLAAIGIYGVMAYAVQQRTQEIGVRMALGASPRDVIRMVVRRGMRLALMGVLIGLVGAWALTPLMASLLYGVKASDPVVLTSVAVLLSAVALVASLIPARRATRVDPVLALRLE